MQKSFFSCSRYLANILRASVTYINYSIRKGKASYEKTTQDLPRLEGVKGLRPVWYTSIVR